MRTVNAPNPATRWTTGLREFIEYVAVRWRHSQRPLELYVIQFGDKVKVGITDNYLRRMAEHEHAAKAAGVDWHPLWWRERHMEARQNERAIVKHFGGPQARSEYLRADAGEVLRYARTLPATRITAELYSAIQYAKGEIGPVDQWPEWVWDRAVENRHQLTD